MICYFEAYKPVLLTKRVTWQLPDARWYKSDTDGASKGNPGPSSNGFCVRNEVGDLMYTKADNIGVTTNVVAEAKAILQGLEYCVTHDLHPLILETNSLVLKKVIEGKWVTPWCIGAEVQKIRGLREHFNVIFQHVYREVNTVADYIANNAFNFAGSTIFYSFIGMTSEGRKLLNLDKSQTPNLRI
ncbi:uncharacterized protein LOC142168132 [Nicotiana tabacum]|uniref:Uncharacterized protein LOC142168132 n=1 Tax=Nicotiana tabacum TaxID=4097 RepID=A0AC58SIW6_TOBAC